MRYVPPCLLQIVMGEELTETDLVHMSTILEDRVVAAVTEVTLQQQRRLPLPLVVLEVRKTLHCVPAWFYGG